MIQFNIRQLTLSFCSPPLLVRYPEYVLPLNKAWWLIAVDTDFTSHEIVPSVLQSPLWLRPVEVSVQPRFGCLQTKHKINNCSIAASLNAAWVRMPSQCNNKCIGGVTTVGFQWRFRQGERDNGAVEPPCPEAVYLQIAVTRRQRWGEGCSLNTLLLRNIWLATV